MATLAPIPALLATAATHKLRAPRWFAAQLEAYALLPQGLLKPAARALPLVEGVVALGKYGEIFRRNTAASGVAK